MIARPAAFERMAGSFQRAFGNVDAIFTIDGVRGDRVRAILRQRREDDLAEDGTVGVEGMTHVLSVPAETVQGIASQWDSVEIDGRTYGIGNRVDDGRAMMRFLLSGNI